MKRFSPELIYKMPLVKRGKPMFTAHYYKALMVLFFFLTISGNNHIAYARDVDMAEVKALAKLPVKKIIQNAPVTELEHRTYWETVEGSKVPVVVLFYSNKDKHSQNVATLLRYVASDFSSKLLFCSFMVVNEGKPNKETLTELERLYSLDKIPGVLFYDHDTGRMELEHEHYEIPKFKAYQTPSMLLWKTYYNKVEEIIKKKILD